MPATEMPPFSADVAVMGGGIAGLACALALADCGLRVLVLERAAFLGGRAASWQDAGTGDMVDIGPHVLHSEYANMIAWLQRLGTRDLITWQPDKVLTLATSRRLLPLRHWPLPPPLSLFPSLLASPDISLADAVSMTKAIWHGMRFGEEDVEALDKMSALDFLHKSGVSQHMIDWWWAFAAMVVTNVPLDRCSAAYLMRIHAQLSGHRRLHFGFAAVGLSELYAPAALRAIESGRGRVILGAEVTALAGNGRIDAAVLADGTQVRARHFVSALPPHELSRIVPDAWRKHPPFARLAQFEPSPYISCYLWFDRKVGGERFVSHLWSPERLNYDFYDLSRIRAGWARRPSVIASNIIYSHRAGSMDDQEIVRATQRELAEFAPDAASARVLHARVHRIPMAIPCPTPGIESLRPGVRSPIPGLTLAGDWVDTQLPFCMESAVRSGWLAAEEILAERGQPRQIARPQRPCDGLAGAMRRLRTAGQGASDRLA